ncbi:BrnA antitoxin family protein [Nitratidesulfovibrio vulgaris]|uniref:BrnA antitoxin family protein n=1 Tax=Nitratidesulfovibrio vulgaris TaxID=881 RepID=UPI0013DF8729|nr:BrnA antitoxin family protein [Nitratidesulfovibrio vulgaris]
MATNKDKKVGFDIEEISKMRPLTDGKRSRAFSDAQLTANAETDPDNPILDDTFWERARRVPPPRKKQVTLRLDAEVLEWFKQQGKGYQTTINAILRAYKESRPGR